MQIWFWKTLRLERNNNVETTDPNGRLVLIIFLSQTELLCLLSLWWFVSRPCKNYCAEFNLSKIMSIFV